MNKRLIYVVVALMMLMSAFMGCRKKAGDVAKDVYVAGYETNTEGKTVATLWKNGVPQMSYGIGGTLFNSVFVK